jgi:hypothetical protein
MRCQRCGKPISPLRQLADREFCSDEHRSRGALASASAIRDLEFESDPWFQENREQEKVKPKSSNASLGVVLFVGLMLIFAARSYLPGDTAAGGPAPIASAQPKMTTGHPIDREQGGIGAWLENVIPGQKGIQRTEEFKSGFTDWVSASAATGSSWTLRDGAVHPATLKLWKPTLGTSNYDVEFEGQIEKRAVSWAFRALDAKNYYATKIVLNRPGEASGASIVRYMVENAKLSKPTTLPLPIVLSKDDSYLISFSAQGNRFSTYIDGHLIDEWRDGRFRAGGVGFFGEDGESAAVRWVKFKEHKGFLSRVFATIFFFPPGMELPL